MLKLFRKVRQKLLDNRNLKRYLIYAIGEILLVMIGILLALQVSNWNQTKIDNKKELKALTDLSKEFELNEKRIQAKQGLRVSIVPKLEKYIDLISLGKADYNSFKDLHKGHLLFGMTNPSDGVIDALISSGEISLIKNDTLKYHLADWKNQMENLYENEQILWNSGIEYLGSISDKIPNPGQKWNDWHEQKFDIAFEDLISSVHYRNILIGFDGTNKVIIEECESVLDVLDKVLSLLQNEIRKHKG